MGAGRQGGWQRQAEPVQLADGCDPPAATIRQVENMTVCPGQTIADILWHWTGISGRIGASLHVAQTQFGLDHR